jgi:hypothetical protein
MGSTPGTDAGILERPLSPRYPHLAGLLNARVGESSRPAHVRKANALCAKSLRDATNRPRKRNCRRLLLRCPSQNRKLVAQQQENSWLHTARSGTSRDETASDRSHGVVGTFNDLKEFIQCP